MKISINTSEYSINLTIPNRIMLSSLALKIVNKSAKDGEMLLPFSPQDLRHLRKTVKKMKKLHPGLPLVDIEGDDGDKVKIYL